MNSMLLLFVAAISAATVSACSSQRKTETPAAPPTAATKGTNAPRVLPATLEEAIASTSYRSAENTPRDQYRHPLETLNFFGLKPNMTVVEISPGNGWYTEILAPYLAKGGHYIAALPVPSPDNKMATDMYTKISDWLKDRSELGAVTITAFAPPDKTEVAPDGSADLVVTFRNVHNWMAAGSEQAAFNGFFKALKRGGTLGVVEHRANAKSKRDPKAKSGYVLEKDVLAFAKKAGFKFVAKSEINANSKDTKNYPEGVWTLPPTLKLKEQDQAKYLAIGESDRMTMKFVKP